MANKRPSQETALAIGDIVDNHIVRIGTQDDTDDFKLTLPELKEFANNNALIVAYDSGDLPVPNDYPIGQKIIFESGVTTLPAFQSADLEVLNVQTEIIKGLAGNEYSNKGIAYIKHVTSDTYHSIEVYFDPTTNTVRGALKHEIYIAQSGTDAPVITEVSPIIPGLIHTPAYLEAGRYQFIINEDFADLVYTVVTGASKATSTGEPIVNSFMRDPGNDATELLFLNPAILVLEDGHATHFTATWVFPLI